MSSTPPPTELDQPPLGSQSATGFRTSRARSTTAALKANQPASATSSVDAYNAPLLAAIGTQSGPPLPKRNKGSRFIAFIFLATIGVASYLIYSTCFRFKCFGVVQGRIITVSAPWSGNVASWQIREGEQVKQGDLLASIDNIEMRHQLESLQDDLMLNQAQIEAEMSRVQFLA